MHSVRRVAEAAHQQPTECKQWGEMGVDVEKEYCCCELFPIVYGVYLIGVHCLLQAAYAVGVVATSYHRPREDLIVLVTAGGSLSLVPTGILVLWANMYQNWKGARMCGFLLFIGAFVNCIMGGLYFVWFVNFRANSQLDRALFWRDPNDWITSSDAPLTFWHLFSFALLPVNLIWFYYSRVLCRLSVILKAQTK